MTDSQRPRASLASAAVAERDTAPSPSFSGRPRHSAPPARDTAAGAPDCRSVRSSGLSSRAHLPPFTAPAAAGSAPGPRLGAFHACRRRRSGASVAHRTTWKGPMTPLGVRAPLCDHVGHPPRTVRGNDLEGRPALLAEPIEELRGHGPAAAVPAPPDPAGVVAGHDRDVAGPLVLEVSSTRSA